MISKTVRWNQFSRELKLPSNNEDLDDEWAQSNFDEAKFPYWRAEWYSVYGLHDYLLEQDLGEDLRFLELGCGAGVLAQIFKNRPGTWVFSDLVLESLRFIQSHIPLQASDSLCCGSWDQVFISELDYILASDVLYEPNFVVPLAQFVWDSLNPNGQFILANPQRTGRDSALMELKNAWKGSFTQVRRNIQMNSLNIEIDVAILTKV